MDTQEIVKSWFWRIKRAGHTQASFCQTIQVSKSAMSQYINGKQDPSLKTFNKIENKLKELEEKQEA